LRERGAARVDPLEDRAAARERPHDVAGHSTSSTGGPRRSSCPTRARSSPRTSRRSTSRTSCSRTCRPAATTSFCRPRGARTLWPTTELRRAAATTGAAAFAFSAAGRYDDDDEGAVTSITADELLDFAATTPHLLPPRARRWLSPAS
jgi:hypothetical protein